MRSNVISRSGKWLGASALAIVVGLGGVSTAYVASSQHVSAQQVQSAAEIDVPSVQPATGFADLVEAVKPAVVSIQVEAEEGIRQPGQRGGQFNFNMPDLPEDHPLKRFFDQFGGEFGNGQGGGTEQQPRHFLAAGSGFVISADGYIVTNNHVVENATKVTVAFDDGNELDAKVIGTDPRTDLAVLKVEGRDMPFVKLSEADVRAGDWVVAVGNPFGLGGTVTAGIVSARGRDIGGSSYGDFLQIDAAVNTGNSGGPAFNLAGDVVGVNTAIYSPNGGGNVGIAFAIPAPTVRQVVDQLIQQGSVTRGFLGVSIQDVTRDIANGLGLQSSRGAIVREATEGSPAAKAGVRSGDVITAVNDDEVDNALDLSRTISQNAPGSTVNLKVWRDGAEQTIAVTLEKLSEDAATTEPQQPQAPAQPDEVRPSSVGITLVPNAGGQGLLIQEIDPNSPAAERGLAVGDSILEVDNQPVANVADFEAALTGVRGKGRDTALVKAERNGEARFIGLPLQAANQ